MSKLLFAFTVVIIVFDATNSNEKQSVDQNLIVDTKQGKLEGLTINLQSGKIIKAFIGVRYAEPPIGDLRFRPPVLVKSWDGVRSAKTVHTICPQRDSFRRDDDISGDEDCLFLNVYTPFKPTDSPLPVMVFFHGGGFLAGSGNSMFYGPDFLMEKDIVLVVPNYRLGALGFLSTGDKVLSGNYGLKDQHLVLKWIQDNIGAFNGDPNSVTIFGNSAGGASVTFHMMSPKSKGLFHRAISQSGTLHCPWALAPGDQSRRFAKQLGEILNCDTSSSTNLANCLRKQDVKDIISKDIYFEKWDKDPMMPFKPVIEDSKNPDAFFTQNPYKGECKFESNVPWIVGITKDEGAIRIPWLYTAEGRFEEFIKDFDNLAPLSLYYDETSQNIDKDTQTIKQFYFDNKPITKDHKQELIDLYSDGWFSHGIAKTLDCVRKTNMTIYVYLLGYKGSSSFSKIFGDSSSTGDYGVSHADELQYLFPIYQGLWPHILPNEKDIEIRNLITSFWTNFAKTGNPTINSEKPILKSWTPVQSDNIEFLSIGLTKIDMQSDLLKERLKLWRNIHQRSDSVRDEL